MIRKDLRTETAQIVKPDIVIKVEPEFSGNWVVSGDVNGDGRSEFVTARNNQQEVTALSAYTLDGNLLWTWGKRNAKGPSLSYDVPCQIYDMEGNGKADVFISIKGFILVLNGENGEEKRRHPLPKDLEVADCISFANFSGNARPTDIVIKSRYRKVWAYTKDWELIWEWEPWSRKTCHHPTILDLNGNGRDEILVGKPMLDYNGEKVWKLSTRKTGRRGHLDAQRVVKLDQENPEKTKIIYTYCGGNLIACINGKGKLQWRDTGYHFESIDVGNFNPNYPAPQYYTDIDHTDFGKALGFFYDKNGNRFGEMKLNYGRQHRALDWTGDGYDEVVIANELMIMNGKGEVINSLEFQNPKGPDHPPQKQKITKYHMAILDISGKSTGDIVIFSQKAINIYFNPSKKGKKHRRIEDFNFTFY